MRISLAIADFTSPGGPACLGQELARVAVAADQLGFDSLSVMDHFFQIRMIGPPEREMLEGYTTPTRLSSRQATSTGPSTRICFTARLPKNAV
jgi:alkanesulfonate monooxygenase SsuD/methylene tetrahydromethanopterin reductase-like flavin-dependent oxidoreductase (luciferase family)